MIPELLQIQQIKYIKDVIIMLTKCIKYLRKLWLPILPGKKVACRPTSEPTSNNLQFTNMPQTSLLRCDTLGKITRLIDVISPENSEMICQ